MIQDQRQVTLFTLSGCGPCAQARRLLRRRGIQFEEVRGDGDPRFAERLLELSGGVTVPQVLIDGVPVGGADRLAWLDRHGLLRPLVEGREFPIARPRRRLVLRRLPLTLFSAGARAPWRYEAELVDREGRVLERQPAGSWEEATRLAGGVGGGERGES
jgi:glutaredoxin 3